jgi:hypothetical protein
LFTTSCGDCDSHYCPSCGYDYQNGYKDGYADGYKTNDAFKNLSSKIRYTQWCAYGQNGDYYKNSTYIYDFDLIREGYLTIVFCKVNDEFAPVKCMEYKQYPYEIISAINSTTLLIYVYISTTQIEKYKIKFVSTTSTKQMDLHFYTGNSESIYDCRKITNPASEIDFLDILY